MSFIAPKIQLESQPFYNVHFLVFSKFENTGTILTNIIIAIDINGHKIMPLEVYGNSG